MMTAPEIASAVVLSAALTVTLVIMPRPKPEFPPPEDEKQPPREIIIESQDLRPDTQRVTPLPQPAGDGVISPQAQRSIVQIEQRLDSILVRVKNIEAKVDQPAPTRK